MKLSLVFELLLIFVLLAFAASKSVNGKQKTKKNAISNRQEDDIKIEENGINKFCKCSEAFCNCCRDFQIPLVRLDGPGCASLMYLKDDKMAVSLSFGRKVITNRTLSGKKPSPVCMPLPGGISKFCGRVYNIARAGEEFRACLGLELQSKSVVEAAVRVSCFKFGPRGVTSEPADPLPLVPKDETESDDDDDDDDEEEDDDDDDDDDFGLGDDDDIDAVGDVGGVDYSGFSLLGEDLLDGLLGGTGGKKPNKNKNKKLGNKQAPLQSTTTTTTTTTKRPRPNRRPTRRPSSRTTTPKAITSTTVRIRPAGTGRPSRRPTRRPNRRTTTTVAPTIEIIPDSVSSTPATIQVVPAVTLTATESQSTERIQLSSVTENKPSEPVMLVSQKIVPTVPSTTSKPAVTNFEDPGLQMSLASLAGQLSVMPVTPILDKETSVMTTAEDSKYQKIETITPKTVSTASFFSAAADTESSEKNDDMIQIVQSLDDSKSSENSVATAADESRGYSFNQRVPVNYEGLSKQKKRGNDNVFGDYDLIGLTEIGETIGQNIGVFGKGKKRQNKHKDGKEKEHKNKNDKDDDDYVLTLSELSGLAELSKHLAGGNGNRKNNDNNDNKNNRRRQNKMMRGEWSFDSDS